MILLNLRGFESAKTDSTSHIFFLRFDFTFYPIVNVWEPKMTLGLVKNEVFLNGNILVYVLTFLHNLPRSMFMTLDSKFSAL